MPDTSPKAYLGILPQKLLRLSILFFFALVVIHAVSADDEILSLDGTWEFWTDPDNAGIEAKWYHSESLHPQGKEVSVPHTWQVDPETWDYYGAAWYERKVNIPSSWEGERIQLEFDSVYRDTQVWVNGKKVGEHIGSGWTPFAFPVEDHLRYDRENEIVLCVDNSFSENAIPYLDSFDWAPDGGIIRGVRLRALPRTYIERILVDTLLNDDFSSATLKFRVRIESLAEQENQHAIQAIICDPQGKCVKTDRLNIQSPPAQGDSVEVAIETTTSNPILWHFDQPRLYRVVCTLMDEDNAIHTKETTFGIRHVEVKDGFYYLNGEPMRLMGVEWMPGSDPRYGMAESPAFMREVLRDMKRLNCILSRFHWQQDDAVFEFCDRNGMLLQEEIPAWGPKTMDGDLTAIQALQTREMILAHYNHPSIYAWGLCNEIGGHRESAHTFVKNGIDFARELDPYRSLTYASNSLQSDPQKDASALVDFLEWNDYYETWYGGTVADAASNIERIAEAFPKKSLVISEYGLCESTPKHPRGDEHRIRILRTHTNVYRNSPSVAGAIFFDYNDYRTHIGDKGQGPFKQRVHGVVELLGYQKPSWEVLRRQSSPIRVIRVSEPEQEGDIASSQVRIVTRSLENDLPAYTLRNYLLTWIAYNEFDQPIGTGKRLLPDLPPGSVYDEAITWPVIEPITRVKIEVFRPTGYSVIDTEWKAR